MVKVCFLIRMSVLTRINHIEYIVSIFLIDMCIISRFSQLELDILIEYLSQSNMLESLCIFHVNIKLNLFLWFKVYVEEFETLWNWEPFWCYHEYTYNKWRHYLRKLQVCRRAAMFILLQVGTKGHSLPIIFENWYCNCDSVWWLWCHYNWMFSTVSYLLHK